MPNTAGHQHNLRAHSIATTAVQSTAGVSGEKNQNGGLAGGA